MRRLSTVLAATSLAAGLFVSGLAGASHCRGFDIHTGPVYTGQDAVPGMPNLGGLGCQDPAQHQDINFITPGATNVYVRTLTNNGGVFPTGTIRFDNAPPTTLTFHIETTRNQWLSQVLEIPAGTETITANLTLASGGGSLTYRQLM